MKKTLFTLLALVSMVTASAQSWNFTTVSDADIELLNSSNSGWTHDTSSSNDRYNVAAALNKAPLTVGTTELEYAKGLLFTSTAGNTRIDVKGKRMWLGGSTKVYIPSV